MSRWCSNQLSYAPVVEAAKYSIKKLHFFKIALLYALLDSAYDFLPCLGGLLGSGLLILDS